MKNLTPLSLVVVLALVIMSSSCEKQASSEASTTEVVTEKTSTYSETKNAYFGDLHIHTSWSFDAFIYNVRTTPDDAYNYGKGLAIDHVSGKPIQLGRPLDFMA